MACELITHGYADDCQSNVGGIKALYIFNYGVLGTQPTANYGSGDTIDQLNLVTLNPQTSIIYKYEVRRRFGLGISHFLNLLRKLLW